MTTRAVTLALAAGVVALDRVTKAMVEAGMPPDRISAASFGEAKPVSPNDSEEGRSANRRIEIVVVPDLSGLPGFDELNRISPPTSSVSPTPNQG